MKKLLLFLIVCMSLGYSFAITQSVNETNGINYGYIKKVFQKNGKYYLTVDFIQTYAGADAVEARIEDGICKITKSNGKYYTKTELTSLLKKYKTDNTKFRNFFGNKCTSNNFYTRNTSNKLRTYQINTKAKFSIITSCEETREDGRVIKTVCTPNNGILNFTERYNPTFKSQRNNNPKKGVYDKFGFYSIKLKNSIVTEIAEIYQE